jgi:hypothetical protein
MSHTSWLCDEDDDPPGDMQEVEVILEAEAMPFSDNVFFMDSVRAIYPSTRSWINFLAETYTRLEMTLLGEGNKICEI